MTIAEIKSIMTSAFIANETIREKYGLTEGKSFDSQFSSVSLENIIFYVVATCMVQPYRMFEQFMSDLLVLLRDNKAHTTHWYATRAKEFQFGCKLEDGSDRYDNSKLKAEQVEASRVVKFAAAMEADNQSMLYVKVAGEKDGQKQPLSNEQCEALKAYLAAIRDAGVRIQVVNANPDELKLKLDIYYNPQVLDSEGCRLDGTDDKPIQNAIRKYISNLSFNGVYANQTLIDTIQQVQGVEIVHLEESSSKIANGIKFDPITVRSVPYAGYYRITDNNLILKMIPNE